MSVIRNKAMPVHAQAKVATARLRARILLVLTDNPSLDAATIANIVGAHPSFVRTLISTDEFRDTLARSVQRKHGQKILALRGKMLDTADVAIDQLKAMMLADEDAGVTNAQRLEAANMAFGNVREIVTPKQERSSMAEMSAQVNINITPDVLQRARQLHDDRAKTLELEVTSNTKPTALQLTHRNEREEHN